MVGLTTTRFIVSFSLNTASISSLLKRRRDASDNVKAGRGRRQIGSFELFFHEAISMLPEGFRHESGTCYTQDNFPKKRLVALVLPIFSIPHKQKTD